MRVFTDGCPRQPAVCPLQWRCAGRRVIEEVRHHEDAASEVHAGLLAARQGCGRPHAAARPRRRARAGLFTGVGDLARNSASLERVGCGHADAVSDAQDGEGEEHEHGDAAGAAAEQGVHVLSRHVGGPPTLHAAADGGRISRRHTMGSATLMWA